MTKTRSEQTVEDKQRVLLIEIHGWLKDAVYRAPEVLEEDRKRFMTAIEKITKDG